MIPSPSTHPFDSAASTYDDRIAAHPTLRWMREDNLQWLESRLPATGEILEIGAGTGYEATALALAERRILALDPSPKMLASVAGRAATLGVSDRVRTELRTAGSLATQPILIDPVDSQVALFDGAYSSLGPLNCESDLETVATGIARHLKPGAPLLVSVMSRTCMSELIAFLVRGAFGSAARRWTVEPVTARVDRDSNQTVETWYWSPGDLRAAFANEFRIEEMEPFPLTLPSPSIAAGRNDGPSSKRIRWEERLRRIELLAGFGDHIRVAMRRR